MSLNSGGNIIDPVANPCLLYPLIQRIMCHLEQVRLCCIYFAYGQGYGSISIKALVAHTKIYTDYIPLGENHFLGGYAVHHLLIERYTKTAWKSIVTLECRCCAMLPSKFLSP